MDIREYLKEQADLINDKIREYIPSGTPKKLFDAMAYSLMAGGKRIRPVLIVESAKAVGKENVEEIIDIAVAAEFLHTYSLIHDDLPAMDDDDLRRGKPTCHKVYGEAIAILAGDGLQSYAFELVSKNKNISSDKLVKVINILAHGTGIYGMVGGQAADILHEKENSFDDIHFIHTHKTAKFIQSCCQIGAVLSDASKEEEEALKNYGLYIGLAFQIWDDILDEIGDEEKLGKKTKKDREKNKLTYPSVYGLEKSKNIAKNYVEKAINEIKILKNPEILQEIANYIISREV
ncbi:geranylgeranyl diphosphate synthase, type II [Persephonella hydrogeniphila]|uniref:Geranylgeranyl diphosphate synthase, type II n=1 Tax=Persephonella hydrogeniphila TaxID=198703 RepID=A0A285NQE8_9AQUI|nr:farnesyl diphosphate synthase [Persephonella hydrogeniphila]SNZ09851.1 geranylgeranyl diphosphate synthase, type II [Persephonella hydrogeniphila]